MAISNGFDTAQVMTALQGRLGWIENTGSSPTSGRYFNSFHPLVTQANLRDVQPNVNLTDDDFATLLSNKEKDIIMELLNAVFNTPQLIESTLIFDRQLRNDIPYTNYGNFVGYRLFIAPGDYAAQISRVSLMFNDAATFNLYLFQDMKKQPLFTQQVTTSANEEVLVDLQNWIIRYAQPTSQGGVFYLGYFQNDLGNVQALDQFVNRWNKSIAFGYTAFEARPVGNNDFVRIQVPYTYKTYGMNLEIQTYNDYTNKVVKNASLFDEGIGLAMAIKVLSDEAYSTRSNTTERMTKEMASLIYGDINNSGYASEINPYVAGLKKRLEREMKRLNSTFFPKPGVLSLRPPIWGTESLQGVMP